MALFKVDQLVERHPGLSVGGIRSDLFHRDVNGLTSSGAIIQRGRHLLIDEDLYLAWLKGPGQVWARRKASGGVRT